MYLISLDFDLGSLLFLSKLYYMNFIQLKKYYKDPSDKVNIISVSAFLLKNSYKNIDLYYYGLNDLVESVPEYFPNFYLRIYFDSSLTKPKHEDEKLNEFILTKWKPFLEKIKLYSYIQLVKFTSNEFKNNDFRHIGLFGTLIRLIPLFDYADNMTNIVIVMDIDVTKIIIEEKSKTFNLFMNSSSKFHFMTRYCYHISPRFVNVEQYLQEKYKPTIKLRIQAGSVISKIKFPKYIFDDFINCLLHPEKNICKYIEAFKYSETSSSSDSSASNSLDIILSYGIDEFFFNSVFLKCLE